MKTMAKAAAAAMVLGWCGLVLAQAPVKEYFSDNFNDGVFNKTLWRKSPYMSNTAIFKEQDGRVLFTRNVARTNVSQNIEWDAKFVRLYDNSDYLATMVTVRAPHKIKAGDASYQVGLGLIEGAGDRFVELTVEDGAGGKYFNLYYTDNNGIEESIYYDAPQNVTVFDLLVDYSAKTDSLIFYWSVPGIDNVFQIGKPLAFSAVLGGSVPRTLQPYMVGYAFQGAAVPAAWKVTLDNFFAYREDAL